MLLVIVILLILTDVVLVACLCVLLDIRGSASDTKTEIRDLRLTSRTRVRQASVQTGATSDEQVLARLGRASSSRRVVVGGEPDSQLNRGLSGVKGDPGE